MKERIDMINWSVAFYASGFVFFVASVLEICGANLKGILS